MVLHVALEVKVSKLITIVDLKKSGELGVGVDLAAIALILERVGADVLVDLLAHGGASHLRANLLSKELGKLVADASGLDKSRRLAVAGSSALLGRSLLGILHLTKNGSLKVLELHLEGRDDTIELLDLAAELGHLGDRIGDLGNGGGSLNDGGRSGGSSLNNGGSGLGLHLLGARGLGCGRRGGGGSSGDGGLIGSSLANHFHGVI